ncbi:FAD:protein FMN transferase [Marinomonas spartinae]|uniref:FAD:protein FMN transferase n=1 Tax=Marinomonas spartinae TaxID=1792290 RepID=UPI0018F158DE|nr:FAD:protein FMN transferase [Marinomonas spartinae]MBJ7553623.1 FAD:protein FMN transferase [Marinomonas spartinae]
MQTSTLHRSKCPSIIGLTAIIFAASLLTGCSKPPQEQHIEGYAQGTTYHITFWSKKKVPTDEVESSFNTTLAQIDKELSTYRPDSYISEFNSSPSTKWQPASQDFIDLINIAKDINKKSEGCYDPTIGPLFDLWGFKKDTLHVPTDAEIAATKADMGLDKIQVDEKDKLIRKTNPLVQLDFSSMGEGYTIGKLSKILESKGINNYLVEFGGDMKIKGHKPDGKKWRIAIQRPIKEKDGSQKVYKIITIEDEKGVTLDTSGTYNHYFDDKGVEYSHILNPSTGRPVTHDLVSASVFGTDPRISDAWATTMLCLGPIEGAKIAKKQHLEVFFIEHKNGKFVNSESEALSSSKRVKFDK